MEKSKKKFYNPYPFVIRVLNDLGKPQILAPQAHCKILGDDPSKIELALLPKSKQREYREGLSLDLEELTKKRLISLAWTAMVDENKDELEALTKAEITKLIKEKSGEEKAVEEEEIEEAEPRQDIDVPGEEEAHLSKAEELDKDWDTEPLPSDER